MFKKILSLLTVAMGGLTLNGCQNACVAHVHCASTQSTTIRATLPPQKAHYFLNDTTKKYMRAKNLYKGNDGCYIACYAHSPLDAIYPVSPRIYLHGVLRIPGYYIGKQCVPQSYEHRDISISPYFKSLCNMNIKTCNKNCWAGEDTGGWFGRWS